MPVPPALPIAPLRHRQAEGRAQVWCAARRRWVLLTPEEQVRQCLLHWLFDTASIAPALLAVERGLRVGTRAKRFDVALYAPGGTATPWLLAECKAPDIPLSDDTLLQAVAYNSVFAARYLLLTNGPTVRAFALGSGGYAPVWELFTAG